MCARFCMKMFVSPRQFVPRVECLGHMGLLSSPQYRNQELRGQLVILTWGLLLPAQIRQLDLR